MTHAGKFRLAFSCATAALVMPGLAVGAAAQTVAASDTPAAADVADIVVTATKRAENLSQIPAAISALGADTLQRRGITQITDINATVPGLQISPNNAEISITIRGVGHTLFSPAAENSVALHLDGVYLSRPVAAQAAFFDVSRVEVLRGPQGTLYGRNATGGAINVVSNDPTHEFSGYLSGTYGNYNRVDLEGVVSGPIAGDILTGRVGAFYHRHDGFGTNLADGRDVDGLDEYGGKASVVAQPSDDLKITLRGDYFHANDSYGLYHFRRNARIFQPGALTLPQLLGGVPAADIRDTNYNDDNHRYANFWGIAGIVDYTLRGGLSLKSTTGYRKTDASYQTDLDATQLDLYNPFSFHARSRQISEELQLSWKTRNFYGIIGGYYFHEITNSQLGINSYLAQGYAPLHVPAILPAPFGVFNQRAHLDTDAKAIFANADWDVTPRLHLGGGVRYSDESKANRGSQVAFFPDFTTYPGVGYAIVDASRSSRAFTPKVTARYDLTDEVNVYASISRGFKSGEWIAGTPQYAQPERVWAYEVGLKGALFGRRLRFSLDGFYYDYSNLQVQRVQTPLTFIENVPHATLKGIEAEWNWRLPAGFSFDGNATYLRTRDGHFLTGNPNISGAPVVDLIGNRFAFAPTFTVNAGIEKRVQLLSGREGVFRFDVQHTSDTYLDIFNSKPNNFRPAYEILNASFRQQLGRHLSLQVWGKNLTNKMVVLNATVTAPPNVLMPTYKAASNELVNLNDPRTYGLTVRMEW